MASWSSKSKIISLCCIRDTSSFAISRYEQGTLGQGHALLSVEGLHRKENIRNVVQWRKNDITGRGNSKFEFTELQKINK